MTTRSMCLVMKPYSTGNNLMPASAQTIYRSSSNPYYHPTHQPTVAITTTMQIYILLLQACWQQLVRNHKSNPSPELVSAPHLVVITCSYDAVISCLTKKKKKREKKENRSESSSPQLEHFVNTSTFPLSTLVSLNWAQLWQTDVT